MYAHPMPLLQTPEVTTEDTCLTPVHISILSPYQLYIQFCVLKVNISGL